MKYGFMLFTVLYLLFPLLGRTQDHSYVAYGTRDGLAGLTVHEMAQSKDGFMWFGTETGLSRFDGVHFRTFTMADGLPSNEILGVFVDTKNRIWLTAFENAVCYYLNGKIHNQENDTALRKIVLKAYLRGIAENDKGDIILWGYGDAYMVTSDNRVVKLPKERILSRATEANNLVSINGLIPTCYIAMPDNVRRQIRPSWYFSNIITLSGEHYYVFKEEHYLYFISTTSDSNKTLQLPDGTWAVRWISAHELAMFNEKGGVEIFNTNKWEISHEYFKNYKIHYLAKDNEQNLWFSTGGSGVFKINKNGFKNLFPIGEGRNINVLDIRKIKDHIYAGTSNNKYWKFKPVSDSFFQKEVANEPVPFFAGRSFVQQIPDRSFMLNGSSDFLHLHLFWGPSPLNIKSTLFVQDTLLLSTGQGVFLFRPNQKQLQNVYLGRTTCAYRKGPDYYIGTVKGLYEMNADHKPRFLGDKIPQFRNRISSFAEGSDGIIWVGVYGKGVLGYKDGKIVAYFTQANGLSSDLCRCLFIDRNNLWVGTDRGLNKIDITKSAYKVTKKITISDGLNSNIINTVYSDKHFVYVGTPIGMAVFDERNLPTHATSVVQMTNIIVSGLSVNLNEKNILLKHKDNNILFEYSGISFLSEGDISYKYRVIGLDERWKTTTENRLNYPSLPSGKYTLELIAINKYHDESVPIIYHFEIQKAVAEKIWFKAGLFLLGVLLVASIVRYSLQRSRNRETDRLLNKQKIMALEQMALRAQMNPHFIFNCLNSMQQYIADGDTRNANFYLSQFAGLVRETLDNSTKVVISVEEEISYLTKYLQLEKLQLQDTFDYTIYVDPEIDQNKTMVPNMVLQPYVENAIKHGISQHTGHGKLRIEFNLLKESQMMECIVEDNGAGISTLYETSRDYNQKLPSNGMSITDKRINILNQLYRPSNPIQLHVIDMMHEGKGSGTRIIIHFPL